MNNIYIPEYYQYALSHQPAPSFEDWLKFRNIQALLVMQAVENR